MSVHSRPMDGDAREGSLCVGTRKDGHACGSKPRPGSEYCFGHDPALSEKRIAGQLAGGYNRSTIERAKRRAPGDLSAVLEQLKDAFGDTSSGAMQPGVARALATLAGAIVRVHEMAELAVRVSDLEIRRAAPMAMAGGGGRESDDDESA